MTSQKNFGNGNSVQFADISSTTDQIHCPFKSNFLIQGRPSYRRSFKLLYYSRRPTYFLSMTDPEIVNFVSSTSKAHRESVSTKFATIAVLIIFLSSLSALFLVYSTFPNVTDEERQHIKLPWNIEDAKQLGIVLSRYKSDHYYQVMAGVFITYIFLQTFAIPGSLFLSILSGFLFPFSIALALVCTCSMVGATLCFLLSQLLGRRIVLRHFPEKAAKWAVEVNKHKDNLFNYIVFLRITPFLPNWFINLTAPVIGVPLFPFAFGTFVGVAPPSFIAIQGGQTLQSMTADDSAFSMTSVIWLAVFGIISLIPIFLKNRLKEKVE